MRVAERASFRVVPYTPNEHLGELMYRINPSALRSTLFALVFLTGCPAAEESDPVEAEPAPPYICPPDENVPCQFAEETCQQTVDCEATCANLVEVCGASNDCESEDTINTTFLCAYAGQVTQGCLAACNGSVATTCGQRTSWYCGGHYDTCEDIQTCYEAGTGG